MKRRDIFINCPFTPDYQNHFRAIVYTIIRSGFTPRCALETDNSAYNRFDKICSIIRECRLAVHNISKTEPDGNSGLPRFNMPLELGLFLAAKKFGSGAQKRKLCIIFDKSKYRYQQFMSDIAGQDIHAHNGTVKQLVMELAAWLRTELHDSKIPGGSAIAREFTKFQRQLPKLCRAIKLRPGELTFVDYRRLTIEWIVSSLVKPHAYATPPTYFLRNATVRPQARAAASLL
jgi:hypothetical protein